MAHLSLSPPSNATTFSPLAKSFNRTTKTGVVPVVKVLIGSHYNAVIGNEMTLDSSGNIGGDSVAAVSGKLEIAGFSNDTIDVTKSATFSPFMYFYPGIKIVGHMELQDATLGTGDEKCRYEFQDLATGDKLQIDFEIGVSNPQVIFREIAGSTTNVLSTTAMGATTKEIYFELDFQEEGITKFYLIDKTAAGAKTRVYNSSLTADIAECKVFMQLLTDQTTTKTIKSDFIWIFYPKIHISYDVDLPDRLNGRVQIYDTVITADTDETNWEEVFSSDHEFKGDRIVENGLIRLWFKPATPGMEVWGYNGSTWVLTGEVIPKTTQAVLATTLHDIIIERFNNSQALLRVKYGIVEHVVNVRRGSPYCRIATTSTDFRINTTKERVALSTGTTATQIQDFNQAKTDDANRGNPMNLAVPATTFTFTDDADVDTGLDNMNDNWFAWYDTAQSNDTVGFIGFSERPIASVITATDATTLSNITWDFTNLAVVTVGTISGATNTTVGGIITILSVGNDDDYVKYRANEGIFSFNQRMTLRKKR
jgi:hypothetical protein